MKSERMKDPPPILNIETETEPIVDLNRTLFHHVRTLFGPESDPVWTRIGPFQNTPERPHWTGPWPTYLDIMFVVAVHMAFCQLGGDPVARSHRVEQPIGYLIRRSASLLWSHP